MYGEGRHTLEGRNHTKASILCNIVQTCSIFTLAPLRGRETITPQGELKKSLSAGHTRVSKKTNSGGLNRDTNKDQVDMIIMIIITLMTQGKKNWQTETPEGHGWHYSLQNPHK